MTETTTPFRDEIDAHRSAEKVPVRQTELQTPASLLEVRNRGCYITNLELSSVSGGNRVRVLYKPTDLAEPKLSAGSHMMLPVSESDGIGGQHGFPRWADYHQFQAYRGKNGEHNASFQAKRSDDGLGVAKHFELAGSRLTSTIAVYNSTNDAEMTSVGEHYYFRLKGENIVGLTINGHTLDELLGDGAEHDIMGKEARYWGGYQGKAKIQFPEGYAISLDTKIDAHLGAQLGMLVWHRPGTETICFEPTLGYQRSGSNEDLYIPPYGHVELTTSIELL